MTTCHCGAPSLSPLITVCQDHARLLRPDGEGGIELVDGTSVPVTRVTLSGNCPHSTLVPHGRRDAACKDCGVVFPNNPTRLADMPQRQPVDDNDRLALLVHGLATGAYRAVGYQVMAGDVIRCPAKTVALMNEMQSLVIDALSAVEAEMIDDGNRCREAVEEINGHLVAKDAELAIARDECATAEARGAERERARIAAMLREWARLWMSLSNTTQHVEAIGEIEAIATSLSKAASAIESNNEKPWEAGK